MNNYPLISFLKFDTKSDQAALTDKCNKFNERFKNCVTIAFCVTIKNKITSVRYLIPEVLYLHIKKKTLCSHLFWQRNNAWRIDLRCGFKASGIATWSGGITTPQSLNTPVYQMCRGIPILITCGRKVWIITYALTPQKHTRHFTCVRC